jgi:hypothetical protein
MNTLLLATSSLELAKRARDGINRFQSLRVRLQKPFHVPTPLSLTISCEHSLYVFPVVQVPSCLFPIDNHNGLGRALSSDDDVGWTEVTVRKDDRSSVWKQIPPRIFDAVWIRSFSTP